MERRIPYGDVIRKLRLKNGLTQTQLGEMVGVSGDMIQKYENNQRLPKEDRLKEIFNALGYEVRVKYSFDIKKKENHKNDPNSRYRSMKKRELLEEISRLQKALSEKK